VAICCQVLGVSRSGYYAWLERGPSRRELSDRELSELIVKVFETSRRTYGAPRVRRTLADEHGVHVSKKRVARLMVRAGLKGVSRRRAYVVTTRRDGSRPAPDLVNRDFHAEAPDELWVADVTYIPTLVGFLYLAVVMDAFSRKIVGWAMSASLRTELVLDALDMAVAIRRPKGVIHHSDQGSQYTSLDFGRRCWEAGVRPSMGSVGDCFDNAMCESFFATLECELLDRETFRTRHEARSKVFFFIEAFYNRRRIHSSIEYLTPEQAEQRWRERQEEHRCFQERQHLAAHELEHALEREGGDKRTTAI
jgi:putative transposase